MKCQEKLYNKVDSYTLDTISRTILLLGEYGCGKKTLISYIGARLGLEIEDISDDLTLDKIDAITVRVSPKIYTIDTNKLTVKNENVILKFLEEPLKNAYIILTAESRQSLIPTVLNRCQVWEFSPYPEDYLRGLVQDSYPDVNTLLKVADTPGKVIEYQNYPLKEMFDLGYKIFNSMSSANFANAMTISRFIAFKNEKDKFDFNLFLDVLLVICKDLCMRGVPQSFDMYVLTSDLNNSKRIFNVDKKALFDTYIIKLKLLVGG